MFRIAVLFVLVLFLAGCGPQQSESYDWFEKRPYRLINFNLPKHFYVDLEDMATGKIYTNVYVSKHCNEFRKLRIGDIYALDRYAYTSEGRTVEDFINLHESLCSN